jgi:putative membrane-bound dehydrogenase-like protein
MKASPVAAFIAIALTAAAFGAEAQRQPVQLPRVPGLSPADAVQSFQVHPGLHIELVAAEPLIESPVGICFDEDGRLFVVEMRGYPDLRDEHLGRIKLLTDSHGDGHYDQANVFADHLPWPTSVFPYGGGVFVTASPDILWYADKNGTAAEPKVVFTGFAARVDRLNVQALVNNLAWGLDDRIHGATSHNGGLVSGPGGQDKPFELRGRDFFFDPRDSALLAENGGGQHGLSFDAFG